MGNTMNSIGSSSNGFKFLEDSKAKRIEQEMKTLKKERDEFFAARFDKVIKVDKFVFVYYFFF